MKTSEPRTLVTHPELHSHQSLPYFKTLGEHPKSWLERLLSLFADVRAGEGLGALLLALNIFLLLAGYSLMKPARDGLILTEGGAALASYSAAAQAVLLMAVVPLYGWLGTRVVRIRLISIMMTFFVVTLIAFYVGGRIGLREGVAFYIWLGLINVFIVSQFWAFANDLYSEGQGRRLFPFIGVGQSLGAWVGAVAVTPLVQGLNYTPYTLMLLGACVLMVALAITLVVNRRETARAEPEAAAANEAPLGPQGGFELVWNDRYLFWIAVLTVLLNVVNTTGGYVLNTLIVEQAGHGSVRIRRGSPKAGSSSPRSRARLSPRSTSSGSCFSYSSPRASYASWAYAERCSSCRRSRWSTIRSLPSRRFWQSCGLARSSRTARTTRFRTRCVRRCFCRRRARPSTKRRRPLIRFSPGAATSFRRGSSQSGR